MGWAGQVASMGRWKSIQNFVWKTWRKETRHSCRVEDNIRMDVRKI